MLLFLTSSPCSNEMPEGVELPCILNEVNDFVWNLRQNWRENSQCLIISADPDDYAGNDEMTDTFYNAFLYHDLSIGDMAVCDGRNEEELPELLAQSDVILLSGGHVPTENAFFERICLREWIQEFDGIVIGISAGTMNCADMVYAQPEREGESEDPDYCRFLSGLGLTELMILPHYQQVKDTILDGKRLYEEITYPDSVGNVFLALVDGSYVMAGEDWAELFGEAYRIEDGQIRQICEEGEHRTLYS